MAGPEGFAPQRALVDLARLRGAPLNILGLRSRASHHGRHSSWEPTSSVVPTSPDGLDDACYRHDLRTAGLS